jgi:hypothetical protein
MKQAPAFLAPILALFALTGCGDDGEAQDDAQSDDDSGSESDGTDPTDPDATDPTEASVTDPDAGDDPDTGEDTLTDTGESGSACNVSPPDAWAAPDWSANTTDALALRASLDDLVGTMRMAEEGMVVIEDVAELEALFDAGAPSVASITNAGYLPVVQGSFTEFVDVVAAGEQDLIDDGGQWTPGPAGGIFGTSFRGINEGGLEVRQLVDKGLFAGGGLYRQAVLLASGPIDEATIDALAALWGANEALDPEGEITDSANYTYQMGFHGEVAASLIAAKAYAGDAACEAERDEAIRTFFRTWELAMLARFVHYANVASAAIELATMDDDFAGALHELGEGLGLALGFYGLEDPDAGPLAGQARVVTDAQLDAIAQAMRIETSALGTSTTGEFVQSYLDFVDAVAEAEGVVAEAYGLTDADLAAFREPTPG